MIKNKLIGMSVFALTALTLSPATLANRGGQFGFSGAPTAEGSCLNCHGSQSYDGLSVTHNGTETVTCIGADGEAAEILKIPYEGSVTFTVTVDDPGDPSTSSTKLSCPDTDCCEGSPAPGADSYCASEFGLDGDTFPANTCKNFINSCETAAVAGLNVLATGSRGGFEGLDTARLKFAEDSAAGPREVSHTAGHIFDGSAATWTMTYKASAAPTGEETADDLAFYFGVNVANNNGFADGLDLNSNYAIAAVVGDDLPSYCAPCEDGSAPDESGQCSGCGCNADDASANPIEMGAVFSMLFGGMLLRRRRRG